MIPKVAAKAVTAAQRLNGFHLTCLSAMNVARIEALYLKHRPQRWPKLCEVAEFLRGKVNHRGGKIFQIIPSGKFLRRAPSNPIRACRGPPTRWPSAIGMGDAVHSDHVPRPDISPATAGEIQQVSATVTQINVEAQPVGARINQG